MRFSGFRNDEEKKVELYLTEKGGTLDEGHKIATLASMEDMDAKYVLTDWMEINWPADYDGSQSQLTAKIMTRNTHIDFFEFATESYKKLYEDSCQKYPLAKEGVMRIEAEHYDANTMTGFDAVDFNGRFGWENGSPGKGTGAIGPNSDKVEIVNDKNVLITPVTVQYNNVVFAAAGQAAAEELTCTAETAYMIKGATQQVKASGGQVSYLSTDPAVLTVDETGLVTAKAAGEASVIALNADHASAPVTIRVADNVYLGSLVQMYEEYIRADEDSYTTVSWNAMKDAFEAAQKAQNEGDAEGVYQASVKLWDAIAGRVSASRMNALNTYLALAESLREEEYSPETWQNLCGVLEKAKKCNKNDSQDTVNQIASELQNALYGLEVLYAQEGDKAVLEEPIARADALLAAGQQQYTDESWAEFIQALEQAKAIMAENPTTKLRVDLAGAALKQAMENLEKKVDYTKLEELYARYKDLSGDAYTEDSYRVFKEARDKVKALLDTRKATQQQVDQLLESLQTAVNQLRQKPTDQQVQQTVTVVYQAEAGGRIQGQTTQIIPVGSNTTEVKAVPDSGYRFVKWSDGQTGASRTDKNVQKDMTIKAQFVKEQAQAPKTASKVTLNKKKLTLGLKETFTLKATVKPSTAKNKKVTWKSSKKSVAVVNGKGKITAKKTGTTTITAVTSNGK
ncbi:MAG TPA: hypothetical protein DF613_06745 [Lachnospiraceae bacterium]|nr:hypothetical protein [Lachnospiraceae bacterium]